MSSLHRNEDSQIASGPVGSDDSTSWFDDADVAGQINSSMEEGVSSEWRAKERVLSWTRRAFGIRPRNIALPASSEVLFCYFPTHAEGCCYCFLPFTLVKAEATNTTSP